MLKEKLQQDVKEALKAGDSEKRLVLNMALNAVKNKELEKRAGLSKTEFDPAALEEKSQLTDDEVVTVIASEVKKRKESVTSFINGGRPELAEKEKKEAEILAAYLPEQVDEEEIRAEVKKAIEETGATSVKDMGKVIGAVVAKLKSRADGQTISRIVKEELG